MFSSKCNQAADPSRCRQDRLNLLALGNCAQLAKLDPAAGQTCYELAPNGFYPRPMGYSIVRDPLIPRNFADQYSAQDNQPVVPASYAVQCREWTMDLSADSLSATPYHSFNPTPNWREVWLRPGALEGPVQGLNENLRIQQNL